MRPGSIVARPGVLLFGVLAVTALTFAPILGHGFSNYDDRAYVTENPQVREGLSLATLGWAFASSHIGHFHPLTWLSLLVDSSLFGLEPAGYHAHALALHLVNVALAFVLLRGALGAPGPAALAAAVFAIHPLQVEPVAWISSRKDVLVGMLALLTLWSFKRYCERPGLARWAAVFAAHAAALLSKPAAVPMPLVLLLWAHWPFGRYRFERGQGAAIGRTLLSLLPLFALSAGSVWMTMAAVRDDGVLVQRAAAEPWARALTVPGNLLHYFDKALVPVRLSVHYPRPLDPPTWAEAASALALLLGLAAVALLNLRRRPEWWVGLGTFVVLLLPTSGLVDYGGHTVADRYTYLPLLGLALLGVRVGVALADRLQLAARARLLAGLLCVGALTALSGWQVQVWRSDEALFRHAVTVSPGNARMENELGRELVRQGRHDEGRAHLERAVHLRPGYVSPLNNLAVLELRQGRLDAAEARLRAVLELDPGYSRAHYNLALVLAGRGALEEAEQHLRRALALRPDYAAARAQLARLRGGGGRPAGPTPRAPVGEQHAP